MIRRFALLQAFVAVARAERMKEAADVLAVTPGAVSQRIRQLEEIVGQPLFTRTREGVELTASGTEMFAALAQPFAAIEAIDRDLDSGSTRKRVVVNTMPSLASTWLVPRLNSFIRLNPNIEVVVETSSKLIDPKRDPVDLAIRHGLGKYAGLESAWLMTLEYVIVASPVLLRGKAPIKTPRECLNYPLLHGVQRKDWPMWFEAQGIQTAEVKKGHAFSDAQLIVAAAIAGQGLALLRDVYVMEALRTGGLVKAYDGSWPAQFGYYAVTTSESLQRPAVRRFRDWLIDEAQRDASDASLQATPLLDAQRRRSAS
jgi:LysR family glycine cleavage system transcriptional activator